jgi:hypothetical protein
VVALGAGAPDPGLAAAAAGLAAGKAGGGGKDKAKEAEAEAAAEGRGLRALAGLLDLSLLKFQVRMCACVYAAACFVERLAAGCGSVPHTNTTSAATASTLPEVQLTHV